MSTRGNKPLYGRHYPGLDLARVVAIILVMLTHLSSRVYFLPDTPTLTFITWGWHGVDLFFALSGFLIGGQIMEQSLAGRFSFKTFYIKRALRIFPPYYFSLLIMFAIYTTGTGSFFRIAINPTSTFDDIIRTMSTHIFYVVNYFGSIHDFQQGIYWSLSMEEQFYIIAPLVLYLLIRYGRRLTPWGLGLLILTGVAIRFYVYTLPTGPGYDWDAAVQRPFQMRFDTFIIGILAAYFFIKHHDWLYNCRAIRAAILAVSLACLGLTIAYGFEGRGYFNDCWQFTLTGLGFSGLVLWLVITPLTRLIRPKKVINHVAKISYPMYLNHIIMIRPAHLVFNRFFRFNNTSTTNFFIFFAVYFLVAILISSFLYRLVDVPFMNYRKRFIKRV